ncbi:MAG: winged helix-turn-helix transcriptional regulator [Proteobacteria bacterium]|nr:winged helix-turn-helix transcriptional regulator [Pseudomonadota bacterium]
MPDLKPADLVRSATAATRLLKALANRNRLLILCQLAEQEMRVGHLSQRVRLSPSAMSQHLAVLKRLGIVESRRDSREVHYSLASGPARQVMQALIDSFCRSDTAPPSSNSRSRRRPVPLT